MLLSVCALCAWAQDDAVQWKVSLSPADARAGEQAQLLFEGVIRKGFHIYSTVKADGPVTTAFSVDSKDIEVAGNAIEPAPKKINDPNFGVVIGTHAGPTVFALPVKIKPGVTSIKAKIVATSQACDESKCLLPQRTDLTLDAKVSAGDARPDHLAPVTAIPTQPEGHEGGGGAVVQAKAPEQDEKSKDFNAAAGKGLISFFFYAFLAGLAALATPCVFPMIPVTVSFFSKQATSTGSKLKGALAYCFGIMGTFVALGLIVGFLFKGAGLNAFAANPWLNIVLALVFFALSLSLFGLFEIQLPPALANKLSQKGRSGGGIIAPIIMGVTFTVTTFTCTVAFIGTLLATATTLGPAFTIMGMLGFSTAFALPFFFFAMFPSMLAKLPKSGGWLATFKGFLGFIEIMAALKFLSNADLVLKTNIFPRDRFLYIWAILALGAALYLAGVLRGKGTDKPRIGWFRWSWVALSLLGAFVFVRAGATGSSLGEFEGLMPPEHDAAWSESLDQSVALAKKEGKKLFVDFTGVSCTNCRWMEKNMFTKNNVKLALKQYVLVKLFCDRPGDEPNAKLLREVSGSVSMPTYAVLDPATLKGPVHLDLDRDEAHFVGFINQK